MNRNYALLGGLAVFSLIGVVYFLYFREENVQEEEEKEEGDNLLDNEEQRKKREKWAKHTERFVGNVKYDGLVSGYQRRFDCSGLIYNTAQDIGSSIPSYSEAQYKACEEISEEECRKNSGTLVFMFKGKEVKHVEMSNGKGRLIGSWVSNGVGLHSWNWWRSSWDRVEYGVIKL